MEELLTQIEDSCRQGYLYLALFCAVALPDVCAAISAPDGLATGPRYKEWFDKYVAPKYGGNFDGDNCYAFRCGVLHQGRAEHKHLGYERVVFVAAEDAEHRRLHNNILNNALNLDLVRFCEDIVGGVREWMRCESAGIDYQRNMAAVLKRHEGGLEKYVLGVDIYC